MLQMDMTHTHTHIPPSPPYTHIFHTSTIFYIDSMMWKKS